MSSTAKIMLTLAERVEFVLAMEPREWLQEYAMPTLLEAQQTDPYLWLRIKKAFQSTYTKDKDVENAITSWGETHPDSCFSHENGSPIDEEVQAYPEIPLAPPLPPGAILERPVGFETWLDAYIAHSTYWAPRAAPAYHEAVGLWLLSTVAARRIVLDLGSTPLYPTLFISLVAPSSTWTKTTAAALGVRILRRANCGHLLAPDRTTPQFLLRLMSGIVPKNYGMMSAEEQADARLALAFCAQKGWFYEEWGGMLHQMQRADSPQAELNKLLIVLEGGAETFEVGTIQRGLERIDAPYLALLGNATPHDLAPFLEEGNAWWHDGFWPRFVFVAPPPGAKPSQTFRPQEMYTTPWSLLSGLRDWDHRLGAPPVQVVEEKSEKRGKGTGIYHASVGALPVTRMQASDAVYGHYNAYNLALLSLIAEDQAHRDLTAWYARAHEKALRVAMLLASVQGETVITLPYWQAAQSIVEGWRQHLHALVGLAQGAVALEKGFLLEKRIERTLGRHGKMTARQLQQILSGVSGEVIKKTLATLVAIGVLEEHTVGRKTVYAILP